MRLISRRRVASRAHDIFSGKYDRDMKARMYAEPGIQEYWLVDLVANAVLAYSSPQVDPFAPVDSVNRGESIAPKMLPACVVAVDVLLAD